MRDNTIDITKGIAIILMVIGHSCCPQHLHHFIYMFHMPLFFIVSGYFFKESYLSGFREFAWKKIKGIYFPYLKWAFIFLLLHNFFFSINFYNEEFGDVTNNNLASHVYSFSEIINRFLHIVFTMYKHEQLLGGYWFLHTLFFSSFLFWLVMLFRKQIFDKTYKDVLIAISLILLCFVLIIFKLKIPGYIGIKEILATLFLFLGFHINKLEVFSFATRWGFIIVSFLLVYLGSCFCYSAMASVKTFSLIPFIITSLLGTMSIMGLSKKMSLSNNAVLKIISDFLSFTGKNTLIILTFHFICFKLVSFIIIKTNGLNIKLLAEYPVIKNYSDSGWWVVYSIVGFIVPLLFVFIMDKIKMNKLIR